MICKSMMFTRVLLKVRISTSNCQKYSLILNRKKDVAHTFQLPALFGDDKSTLKINITLKKNVSTVYIE